jgi:hypothetical protein
MNINTSGVPEVAKDLFGKYVFSICTRFFFTACVHRNLDLCYIIKSVTIRCYSCTQGSHTVVLTSPGREAPLGMS